MKKKLLALFAIVAFVGAPAFSATVSEKFNALKSDTQIKVSETMGKVFNNTTNPTWAAGLVLGTNSGVQINYRVIPQITIEGVVGFGVLSQNLLLEAYGMYNVFSFEINDEIFKVNVGPGVILGLSSDPSIAGLGAGEVAYSFNDDFPLNLALRLATGINFDFNDNDFSPVYSGSMACTYRFI